MFLFHATCQQQSAFYTTMDVELVRNLLNGIEERPARHQQKLVTLETTLLIVREMKIQVLLMRKREMKRKKKIADLEKRIDDLDAVLQPMGRAETRWRNDICSLVAHLPFSKEEKADIVCKVSWEWYTTDRESELESSSDV